MAKVKIFTTVASNFGCTVTFGTLDVTFDKLGCAEVESKEIADKLVENYGGWLYTGEKVKEPKTIQSDDKQIIELEATIQKLNEKIAEREATIKTAEAESQEWKDVVDIQKAKVEKAEAELAGYTEQSGKIIKELELKVGLAGKNATELKTFAVTLEIPEERFKGKSKEELIQIILDESRSK